MPEVVGLLRRHAHVRGRDRLAGMMSRLGLAAGKLVPAAGLRDAGGLAANFSLNRSALRRIGWSTERSTE